jgi:hypothetical protein
MTRPLTCLTLLAAAGAGLYLYQEKHRAQMVDREINRVVHATEQTRDRIGMMRAEWAMLNGPDRLAQLAAQHLALQTVTPSQFAQLSDLGNRLPPVGAPVQPPADIEPPATLPAPMASAAPLPTLAPTLAPTLSTTPAKPDTGRPDLVRQPLPLLSQTGPSTVLPPRPNTPLMVQATVPPRPAQRPVRIAAAKPREVEPVSRPVYAPVMQAFASPFTPQPIHQPSVQQAAAVAPSYGESAPYVGSALGMARTMLAAPVPVGASQGR